MTDTKVMSIEQVISFLDPLFLKKGDNFDAIDKAILRYSWEGKKYEDMVILGYSIGYIKTNLAPKLWENLTNLLREAGFIENNEKVCKKRFRFLIEPIVKRYTSHDLVGQIIASRFKIISLKNRGEFGNTYIGEDLQLNNQPCFIKQLKLNSNPRIKRNFDRETGALYQLGWHCQIPGLLAHFEDENGYFLAHQFIPGSPLSDKLLEENISKPWSEDKVINLVGTILNILEFVHQRNIIHRDIKPSNLIETPDGDIVLINFGSIKQLDANNKRTFIGTPGYAAPEQLHGIPRQCSDIFSLGIMGIQALTGVPPTDFNINAQTGEILWPETVSVSDKFAGILKKMVQFNFQKRYQSVSKVVKDFANLL
ncbi:serine/threonine-protein kinase [Crocosphaera sp.]|uniref:serine/threonine-protein kinase n=1 Tax=Crocosphaera sp. TaxID=2729996 RepID=UPI002621F374|nr:serine/threonine-protein kinase [Crocosphaera sp.]MDJ0582557.1 serine/threonine-protein kinase [Crocosphaera sp.]